MINITDSSIIQVCMYELKAGNDAQYIAGNCADEKDILHIAKESIDRLGGRVDILVNNAGMGGMGKMGNGI